MLSFGEVLQHLMKLHQVKGVDLCRELGIKKAYLSRLISGKIQPRDYALVKCIADALQLTNSEKELLTNAYKVSKFGREFLTLEYAIENIYKMKLPVNHSEYAASDRLPEHGAMVNGMEQITEIVHVLLSEEDTAELLFIPENSEFCNLLLKACPNSVKKIHWLIYLDESEENTHRNLELFAEAVPLMMIFPAEVRFHYTEIEKYSEGTPFPHIVISSKGMLMIERNCESACYFQYTEMVKRYRDYVKERYETAAKFISVFQSYEAFLCNWKELLGNAGKENQEDLLIVEKYPCIIHEASGEDIRTHIKNTECAYTQAQAYIEFQQWTSQCVRTQEIIFTESGIDEYFQMNEFYEFSKQITKSIAKPQRKQFFEKLIAYSTQISGLVPELLRVPLFENSSIRLINVWSGGTVLLLFQYEEAYRIVLLQEKTIAAAFWEYFGKLKQGGLLLSKKETLEVMREYLKKYQA